MQRLEWRLPPTEHRFPTRALYAVTGQRRRRRCSKLNQVGLLRYVVFPAAPLVRKGRAGVTTTVQKQTATAQFLPLNRFYRRLVRGAHRTGEAPHELWTSEDGNMASAPARHLGLAYDRVPVLSPQGSHSFTATPASLVQSAHASDCSVTTWGVGRS